MTLLLGVSLNITWANAKLDTRSASCVMHMDILDAESGHLLDMESGDLLDTESNGFLDSG